MKKQESNHIEKTPEGFSALETTIINAIQDRKGVKIIDIDFQGIESAPSHSFVVCQGNSTSQISAIADNIREEVRTKLGLKPYNYEGYRNSQWIVIDYGDVMAHVFLPDVREYYNIEDLWSDARQTAIPDLD